MTELNELKLTLSVTYNKCVGGFTRCGARVLEHSGASGKELACQCRRLRDGGSIPGSGRAPGGGHGNHSSILAWKIPWTEEPGGLQFTGSQRVSDLACTHNI